MQTLTIGRYQAKLSPVRNMGEFQAKLSKCNGKFKRKAIVGGVSRKYPQFSAGDSTADYVAAYSRLNDQYRLIDRKETTGDHATGYKVERGPSFFAPLNTEPCTLYSGEDTHETVTEDEPDVVRPFHYWNFSAETLTYERVEG